MAEKNRSFAQQLTHQNQKTRKKAKTQAAIKKKQEQTDLLTQVRKLSKTMRNCILTANKESQHYLCYEIGSEFSSERTERIDRWPQEAIDILKEQAQKLGCISNIYCINTSTRGHTYTEITYLVVMWDNGEDQFKSWCEIQEEQRTHRLNTWYHNQ